VQEQQQQWKNKGGTLLLLRMGCRHGANLVTSWMKHRHGRGAMMRETFLEQSGRWSRRSCNSHQGALNYYLGTAAVAT
jgi:hypothetical protein